MTDATNAITGQDKRNIGIGVAIGGAIVMAGLWRQTGNGPLAAYVVVLGLMFSGLLLTMIVRGHLYGLKVDDRHVMSRNRRIAEGVVGYALMCALIVGGGSLGWHLAHLAS